MPMTAYARLMQLKADIEKVKAMSVTQQIAANNELDLLRMAPQPPVPGESEALLPGEQPKKDSLGLRPVFN